MSWPWIVVVCALAALVLGQTFAVLGLVGRATAVLERAEEALRAARGGGETRPAVGSRVPDVEVEVSGGRRVRVGGEFAGRAVVVLVLGAGCPFCERLVDALAGAAVPPVPSSVAVLAVSDTGGFAGRLPGWVTPAVESERAFSRAWGVDVVPLAIAVGADGRVRDVQVPGGDDTIRDMARALETQGAGVPAL